MYREGISVVTRPVHLVAILFPFIHKIAGKVFESLMNSLPDRSLPGALIKIAQAGA
jgi:hypothetical protein